MLGWTPVSGVGRKFYLTGEAWVALRDSWLQKLWHQLGHGARSLKCMGVNSCHWSVDVRNICLFVCLFVPKRTQSLSYTDKEWNMEVRKNASVPLGGLKHSSLSLYNDGSFSLSKVHCACLLPRFVLWWLLYHSMWAPFILLLSWQEHWYFAGLWHR